MDRLGAAMAQVRARAENRDKLLRGRSRVQRDQPCASYVFSLPWRMKVGISRHPQIREMEISLAAGEWVGVVQVVWFKDRAEALEWETRAHLELSEAHILGEWFNAEAVSTWLEEQPIGPGRPTTGLGPARLRVVASRTREVGAHNHAPSGAA